MTYRELIEQIQLTMPDYWAWLQSKPNALRKVENLARAAADAGWNFGRLQRQVQGLRSYGTFTSGGTDDEAPEAEEELEEELIEEEDPFDQMQAEAEAQAREDARDLLRGFLADNELPNSLMSFIENALSQNWSYARIVAELRQTPEYLAAYPEMALRRQAGWNAISEAEVRATRTELRRLAFEYFGAELSDDQVATIIGTRNKSVREYERDLQVLRDVDRLGPIVKMVLGSELGYEPDDELVYRFLHGEIRTPDLDRAYARAVMRGQPASIGLGIRPEEEATILEQFGISPEQAFRGYQGILSETPRAERMAMIQAEIERNIARFPDGPSMASALGQNTFATLFRAIQLGDPESLRALQTQLSQEVARFRAGGGVAQAGSGAAVGLLTAAERAQR
jgi:hypothetical protein